jgi:hypothetical protein
MGRWSTGGYKETGVKEIVDSCQGYGSLEKVPSGSQRPTLGCIATDDDESWCTIYSWRRVLVCAFLHQALSFAMLLS